jgi:hypothetical protein
MLPLFTVTKQKKPETESIKLFFQRTHSTSNKILNYNDNITENKDNNQTYDNIMEQ